MDRHLHFVQSLEPLQGGGLGSATLELHQNLILRGGSTLIATRENSFQSSWPGAIQCVRKGPAPFYYSPDMAEAAAREVGSADWVHAHGLYVYPNYVCGKECRRQSKPFAYHIHGFFDPWILNRSKWKKRLVRVLFENRNLRSASFLRALTTKEEAQIRAVGLKNPIAVIPNGISLESADETTTNELPLPYSVRKRPRRVLFLSRLHPKKGLDILIKAWAQISKQSPDWELSIVGPDEGGYQAVLEALIRNLGLDGTCTILPPVSGGIKHQIYQSAELFVLPSYSEGFPMAVLEAASHRLPVVLTTECNFPELEAHGAAWMCLPEINSLKKSLSEALQADDNERIQRGLLGRQLVENRYTWGKVVDALEAACHAHA